MECNICTDTYAVNTGMMCRVCTYRWCDTCEKRMKESGRTRMCSQCRVGTENFIQIGVPINVPIVGVINSLHYSQCSAMRSPQVQCPNRVLTTRSGAVMCSTHS